MTMDGDDKNSQIIRSWFVVRGLGKVICPTLRIMVLYLCTMLFASKDSIYCVDQLYTILSSLPAIASMVINMSGEIAPI